MGIEAQVRDARSRQDFVAAVGIIGAAVAGVALIEAALVPVLLIGGAAVLAPKLFPDALPKLRRSLRPVFDPTARRPISTASRQPASLAPKFTPARFSVKRALAKTITFRVIVSSIDFAAHYIVIGELGAAVGLSAFSLVFGPAFYFVHEAAWDHLGPSVRRPGSRASAEVDLPAPPLFRPYSDRSADGQKPIVINRALAKTATYHTAASAADFAAHYFVIGDLAQAARLSAFLFVAGPFIYLGHEMVWDSFGPPRSRASALPAPMTLMPAPAA